MEKGRPKAGTSPTGGQALPLTDSVPVANLELNENWSLRLIRYFLRLALIVLRVPGVSAFATFESRAALDLDNLALRHEIGVLERSVKRPRLAPPDPFHCALHCGAWNDWRSARAIVKPGTVIVWHRQGGRLTVCPGLTERV